MPLRVLACNHVLHYLASPTDRSQVDMPDGVESNALEIILSRIDAGLIKLWIPSSQIVIEHLYLGDNLPFHAFDVIQRLLKRGHTKLPADEGWVLEQSNLLAWASDSLDFDSAMLLVYANVMMADAIITLTPDLFDLKEIPAINSDEFESPRMELNVPVITPSQFLSKFVLKELGGDNNSIYVHTPQLKIVSLPAGSTPIDFAYAIHTQIGHQCTGVTINGIERPLMTSLNTGDRVEILHTKGAEPDPSWLDFAITTTAKQQIRRGLRKARAKKGWEIIKKTLGEPGSYINQLEEFALQHGYHSLDEFAAAICQASISILELKSFLNLSLPPIIDNSSVWQLASCCNPVGGDLIYGIVRSGSRPIKVHKQSCHHIKTMPQERLQGLDWSTHPCIVSLSILFLNKADVIRPILNCFVDNSFMPNLKMARPLKTEQGRAAIEIFVSSKQDWEKLKILLEELRGFPNVQKFEVQSIRLSD